MSASQCLAHHDLRVAPLGSDPEVEPGGNLGGRHGPAKKESRRSGPGGGKHLRDRPREERLDLVLRPAHGRGRGDDLGPHRRARRSRARTAPRWPLRTGRPSCPSGPEIRCSSSWITRSGGGSGASSRVPLPRLRSPVEPRSRRADPPLRASAPACPTHGSDANLSTVAIRKAGSRR